MTIHLALQIDCKTNEYPDEASLLQWVTLATTALTTDAEICIRIVNPDEIQMLNNRYRKKDKPTNVLSFPFDMEDIELECPILGDLVICADIVNQEATEQHKLKSAHWAHMVIHGTLHLLGYDHQIDEEAIIMEQLEIDLLHTLGYANPYQEQTS